MKVTVKLYADLGRYLPADSRDHAIEVELGGTDSPNDVLDRFGVPRQAAHLVLVNGVYLKPEQRDSPLLHEGDTLAAWPPVAGGGG